MIMSMASYSRRSLLWSLAMAVLLQGLCLQRPSMAELEVGFYSNSCPNAEFIVRSVVERATNFDGTIPAVLLRLHNHDCFVQGCDGSVLIMKTQGEDPPENQAPNHAGLRGFDVIDQAKSELEAECPGVVSCADIVAIAARDAISLRRGPFYRVPTGRRDGLVSRASDAADLPEVQDSIQVLKNKFAEKGLSVNDLVVLTAAHTIGTTACFFVTDRLYRFPDNAGTDPLINRNFLPELMSQCPMGGDVNVRLPLDWGSEFVFDEHILANIRAGFGVIATDAELYADPSTRGIVDEYLNFFSFATFARDFADAMVRMGSIGVKTGSDGEVRRVCSEFN